MSSMIREVLMKFGVIDTGLVRGAAQAESALKRMDSAALSLGKSFSNALLSSLGFGAGVAGVTLAVVKAIDQIGELEQAQLRLKLITADNADEYRRLSALVAAAPRGGLFDDNDVARAVSMGKFLDLTADEIERLLPLLRGMAAIQNEDLATSIQNVAFALETGQVRSLRQYGISLNDVERQAKAAFSAPLKDLDELQRRQAILNAVMEKGSFFSEAEAQAMTTFRGATKALSVELGELLEDKLKPTTEVLRDMARLINEGGLKNIAAFDASRSLTDAEAARTRGLNERENAKATEELAAAENKKKEAIAASIGTTLESIKADKAAAEALETRAKAIGLTVEQFKKLAEAQAARTFQATGAIGSLGTLGLGAGPGGATAGPAAIAPVGVLQAQHERLRLEGLTNDELEEARKAHNERLTDLQRDLSDRGIALADEERQALADIDEKIAQNKIDSREKAIAIAYQAERAFIGTIETVSEQAFRREEGRRKSIGRIVAAGAQEATAAVLRALGEEEAFKAAQDVAAFISSGFTAGHKAAGAAKHTALAAAAGVAAARFATLAEANIGQAEAARAEGGQAAPSREVGQRAFGLTFTRPVENVNITNAISINGQVQLFGTDQTSTMRDLFDQILPLIQEALTSGRLAA